ncbi:MAG: ATP-dependent RecD-like DNA helicase [Anaerolineales bacterium]|nr:ATP-dependent RecD-like DNA helicase [Anaerolineales bacterium]
MDTLTGVVERVTYFNAENGYSVLRLNAKGYPDLVTVVGNLPEVTPGESLRLQGQWAMHAEYGRQFKAERCEQVLPATVEGIRRYLGSGLIKGIGPRTAEKIVATFGAETLTVIDAQPHRLREVPDIGQKRYLAITQAWEQQKAIKEVMVFLQSHGVSAGLAVKIYKQYGDEALNIVQSDPYRLARDIWGIGFRTADKIAQALGIPPEAPARLEAGLAFALSEQADEGHVCVPQAELLRTGAALLEVPAELLPAALDRLEAQGRVRREALALTGAPDNPAVYLAPFYQAEVNAAGRLLTLLRTPATRLAEFQAADWGALFARAAEKDAAVSLSDEQRAAVRLALTGKVTVLTGGPGTGKTTALRALIRLLEPAGHPVALASPTGRAAKRLSEAAGRPAQTLHRLLGYSPLEGFTVNEHNRLAAHLVVVDEVSMLDLLLFNALLKGVDPAAHLLLVGDADQLPSVGAGNVLGDLIHSGQVPLTRLSVIFRQAAESHIITNAHRINQGQIPVFPKEARDFYLFAQEDAEQAAELTVDVVANRVPRKFGLPALTDIQVLAPMHRGAAGVAALNQRLQAALNPPAAGKPERPLGGRVFRAGDRVMQIRNNYQKEAFNGDIGRILDIDLENQTLTVEFDGRAVFYDWLEADELQHAFAVSIHKAQGSEFPAVVVPLLTQHYVMLQRNLLYTAVTRARQLCVLVGSRRAIAVAVRNATVSRRWSGLAERLQRGDAPQPHLL